MSFKRDPRTPDREKHCSRCDLLKPAETVHGGVCGDCLYGPVGIGGINKKQHAANKKAKHEENKKRRAEENRARAHGGAIVRREAKAKEK